MDEIYFILGAGVVTMIFLLIFWYEAITRVHKFKKFLDDKKLWNDFAEWDIRNQKLKDSLR